jgi:hypothetical protein
MREQRRTRIGIVLVMAGLVVQTAAAFFWSPATFLLSAGVGLPLVLAGAVALATGLRAAAGLDRAGEAAGDGGE